MDKAVLSTNKKAPGSPQGLLNIILVIKVLVLALYLIFY